MTFLVVALVVIVAPGPDFVLTVRNTAVRGRRAGIATVFGVVAGQTVWSLAAAAGIAAALLAAQSALAVLRLAGAAYLVYLGVTALLNALRGGPAKAPRRLPVRSPSAQGLLSNLTNPKMPVFFTSLLPQFGGTFVSLAAHGLAFALLSLGWLCLVACAGAALHTPMVRRTIDAASGVVLVALGLHLAAERR